MPSFYRWGNWGPERHDLAVVIPNSLMAGFGLESQKRTFYQFPSKCKTLEFNQKPVRRGLLWAAPARSEEALKSNKLEKHHVKYKIKQIWTGLVRAFHVLIFTINLQEGIRMFRVWENSLTSKIFLQPHLLAAHTTVQQNRIGKQWLNFYISFPKYVVMQPYVSEYLLK